MLWSMYWLNYLDRNAIALARLNDLEDDLNLTDTRESTTTKYAHRSLFSNISTSVVQNIRLVSPSSSWATSSDRFLPTCS